MGTAVSFHLYPGEGAPGSLHSALEKACEGLHRVEEVFSTWQPDSPVSRWRRGELAAESLPPEVGEVMALCEQAKRLSGGWFDPWSMPGGTDPTGLVKGWSVEAAASLLQAEGWRAGMVNGGGALTVFGPPPQGAAWRIGVQHPWRPEGLACVLEVASGAVATSGTYQRGPHLVDPRTGRPAVAAASATVTGPSLALADALATALAVGGATVLDRIAALPGYEAYLIGPEGQESQTPGMPFG